MLWIGFEFRRSNRVIKCKPYSVSDLKKVIMPWPWGTLNRLGNNCDFDSPQREIEELEKAVGEAEVAEAEAGRVARQSHPALVVNVSSHLGIVIGNRLVQNFARAT